MITDGQLIIAGVVFLTACIIIARGQNRRRRWDDGRGPLQPGDILKGDAWECSPLRPDETYAAIAALVIQNTELLRQARTRDESKPIEPEIELEWKRLVEDNRKYIETLMAMARIVTASEGDE